MTFWRPNETLVIGNEESREMKCDMSWRSACFWAKEDNCIKEQKLEYFAILVLCERGETMPSLKYFAILQIRRTFFSNDEIGGDGEKEEEEKCLKICTDELLRCTRWTGKKLYRIVKLFHSKKIVRDFFPCSFLTFQNLCSKSKYSWSDFQSRPGCQ